MKSTYAILAALGLTTNIVSCAEKKTETPGIAEINKRADGIQPITEETKTEQEHFTVGQDSATRKTKVSTAEPVKALEEEGHPHGDDMHKH